jgi:hypothetical protein
MEEHISVLLKTSVLYGKVLGEDGPRELDFNKYVQCTLRIHNAAAASSRGP